MFRIEIKARVFGRAGAFTGALGLPADCIRWTMNSKPELPIPYPIHEESYHEQLRIAKRICRKVGGMIFVIDEHQQTLLVQEWKDGGEIEPELAGYIVMIEHDPAEFRA